MQIKMDRNYFTLISRFSYVNRVFNLLLSNQTSSQKLLDLIPPSPLPKKNKIQTSFNLLKQKKIETDQILVCLCACNKNYIKFFSAHYHTKR